LLSDAQLCDDGQSASDNPVKERLTK